jgi:hypothetical protein
MTGVGEVCEDVAIHPRCPPARGGGEATGRAK